MTNMPTTTNDRLVYKRSLDDSQISDSGENLKIIRRAQEERAKYSYKDWIKRFNVSFRDIKNTEIDSREDLKWFK